MNSSDEAVEAAIKAASAASDAFCEVHDRGAMWDGQTYHDSYKAEVLAVWPVIAAAVRAEAVADPDAQPCTSCEGPTGNPDTFCDACKLDELEQECDRLRAKLAEAVADERRRIAPTLSEIAEMYLYNGDSDRPLNDGYGTLLALADSLAAGSVPVATPEPEWHNAYDCDAGLADIHPQFVCERPYRVATPPAEPAATVHDANCEQQLGACCCHCQKRADVAFSHAAPSQPVTCEHDWADGPHAYTTTQDIDRGVPSRWCPGPVSVPKESSE